LKSAKQELLNLAQRSARAMAFNWYIQKEINTWSPEQEGLYGLPPGLELYSIFQKVHATSQR
jgi:hypothetical protein